MATRRPRRRSLQEARAIADAVVSGAPLPEGAAARRAPPKRIEEQHGIALMQWATRAAGRAPELGLLHHIPNGGGRSKAEAGRLKAQGVKKGVLDYLLPVRRPNAFDGDVAMASGLYVELKEPGRRGHKDGGMSPEQVDFAKAVCAQRFVVALCYDWHEAKEAICAYLAGDAAGVPHRWMPPA